MKNSYIMAENNFFDLLISDNYEINSNSPKLFYQPSYGEI